MTLTDEQREQLIDKIASKIVDVLHEMKLSVNADSSDLYMLAHDNDKFDEFINELVNDINYIDSSSFIDYCRM